MSPGATARDLFRGGELARAIEAQNAAVRARPTDAAARGVLVDLLCFQGHWERADQQLGVLGQQDARAALGVALARQLIRAAQWRQQFFRAGRLPEFVQPPCERVRLHLEASVQLRAGDTAGALRCLDAAEEARPHPRGRAGEQAFDDFRDLDDLCASVLEVLTSTGKYYWIPLERVRTLEPRRAASARDLLWRPATLVVADGPEGEVYLPALYPGSEDEAGALGVGRATEWSEAPQAPVRGRGLRTFLVGEGACTLPELGPLVFEEGT